jgi:hypothetical protein
LNLKRRLQSLERKTRAAAIREPFRIIISRVGGGGPKHSTCSRTRNAGGELMEIVRLSGRDQYMSDEELETFIAGFPIQSAPWLGPSGHGGKHAG